MVDCLTDNRTRTVDDVRHAEESEGLPETMGERLVREVGIGHGARELERPDDHRDEDERPAAC